MWGNRHYYLAFVLGIGMLSSLCFSQAAEVEIFDGTTDKVKNAIIEAAQRQSIYSYNIANHMTPGFKPILTEADYRILANILPEDGHNSDVMLEHYMAQLTDNRNKHSAYVKLMQIKMGILRQVVTLGKK